MRTIDGGVMTVSRGGKVLVIRSEMREGVVRMKAQGAVTSLTEDDFVDEIIACLSAGRSVEIDLGGVSFMSSTAQRKLLEVQSKYVDKSGLAMELCEVGALLYQSFARSHLHTQLRIRREE